ncbi:MAG: hypothetical protein V1926_04920 [Candidatus Peregrinibacteria bacterium]
MENLDSQIQAILERNLRVEADKAWEVSWCRRLTIALLTYATAVIFLYLIGNAYPWQNAVVPPIAYILSTLSLPPMKKWWCARYRARSS